MMIVAKRNPANSNRVRLRAIGRFARQTRGNGVDMRSPGIHDPEATPHHPVTIGALDQMQHDIRTPLGTILGLSELLTSMASTPQECKIAATLKSSSEDLRRQIDALFETLRPETTANDKN